MFTSGTTCVVLLFLLATITIQGPVLNSGCSEPMSRDAAAACCRAHGSVPPFPMPMTLIDNNLLYDMLMNVSMDQTWLGLTRIKMDTYQWVNGTVDEFQEDTAGKSCVAINVTSKVKRAEFCNTEDHGYICERKGCNGCASLGIWKDFCVKDGGRCFIVLCERESWFNARSRCIEQGWDLASTVNIPIFQRTSRCPLYWVGLRREKWITENGTEHMSHTSWGIRQPVKDGNCAIYNILPSSRYEWTAVNCSEPESFICSTYFVPELLPTVDLVMTSPPAEVTSMIELTSETNSGSQVSRTALILGSVLGICITLLSTILVAIFIRKKITKRKKKETTDNSHKNKGSDSCEIEQDNEMDDLSGELSEKERIMPGHSMETTDNPVQNKKPDSCEIQQDNETDDFSDEPSEKVNLLSGHSTETTDNTLQSKKLGHCKIQRDKEMDNLSGELSEKEIIMSGHSKDQCPSLSKKETEVREQLGREYIRFCAVVDMFVRDYGFEMHPLEDIYTDLVWTQKGKRTESQKEGKKTDSEKEEKKTESEKDGKKTDLEEEEKETESEEEKKTDSEKMECYSDMLEDEKPTRVLLRGEAGTGKTTLCRKIVTDWGHTVLKGQKEMDYEGKRERVLKQFEYVVLIALRYVTKGQTLSAIISRQLKLNKEATETLLRRISSTELGALFLIDGYDEYEPNTSDEIDDLINRVNYPHVNLLVTTRDLVSNVVTSHNASLKEALLLGFSKEVGVRTYITKFFKKQEQRDGIISRINESKDLSELSVFPAILHLMCMMWNEKRYLSDTMTSFYNSFIEYACERHNRKKSKEKRKNNPPNENILERYACDLMAHGELSVLGMMGTRLKLIFVKQDVDKVLNLSMDLGFLKHEESGNQLQYTFIHKSVQEYFVAYYITNVKDKEKKIEKLNQLFGSSDSNVESALAIRFLAGLDENSVSDMLEVGFNQSIELGTHMLMTLVAENPESKRELPAKVHLKLNPSYTVKALENFFKQKAVGTREITVETGDAKSCWLLDFLHAPSLEKLTIKKNGRLRKVKVGDPIRWSTLQIPFQSVQTYKLICFERTDNIDVDIVELCRALQNRPSVRSLDLSDTYILQEMGTTLAKAFPNMNELRQLRLCNTSVNEENLACTLLKSLQEKNNKLEVLDLSGNRPNIRVLRCLLQLIPMMSRLRELYLFDISEKQCGLNCAWQNLTELGNLVKLHIGKGCVTEQDLGVFCCTLEKLHLECFRIQPSCSFIPDNLNRIILMLKTNKYLKTLDLCKNSVDMKTLESIAGLMLSVPLKTLILTSFRDDVTDENAFKFITESGKCETLKELTLPGYNVQTKILDFLRLHDDTFPVLEKLILPGLPLDQKQTETFQVKMRDKFHNLAFEI